MIFHAKLSTGYKKSSLKFNETPGNENTYYPNTLFHGLKLVGGYCCLPEILQP